MSINNTPGIGCFFSMIYVAVAAVFFFKVGGLPGYIIGTLVLLSGVLVSIYVMEKQDGKKKINIEDSEILRNEEKKKIISGSFDSLFKYNINGNAEELYCAETTSGKYVFDCHFNYDKRHGERFIVQPGEEICSIDIMFSHQFFESEFFPFVIRAKDREGLAEVFCKAGEKIAKGKVILFVNYDEPVVEEFKKKKQEEAENEEKTRKDSEWKAQEKEEREEIEEAKHELLERLHKKEIEEIALHELIDEGLIKPGDEEELKEPCEQGN